MSDVQVQRVDLRRLLAAIEEAPPIDVVDVLAAERADMVDASHVSLLIANFSGSAVVRLSHVTRRDGLRAGHNERVEPLSLTESIYTRILFSQSVEVVHEGDSWLVLLPVTSGAMPSASSSCPFYSSRITRPSTIS